MKRRMSILLALVLLLCFTTGAFTEKNRLCAENPVEYTVAVTTMSGNGDPNESEWLLALAKETNVKLNFIAIPDEVKTERTNLLLMGNMPDAFMTTLIDQSTANQLGLEGTLVPLEELIAAHAPNIQKMLDENPTIRAQATASDGHIYALPKVDAIAGNYQTVATEMFINTQWLEKVGKQIPTTTDELYDVLKAFAETDLGEGTEGKIPLGFDYVTYDFGCMLPGAFGVVNSVKDYLYYDADAELGENYRVSCTDESYAQWLRFMHKLYAEKLLDQDVLVQDRATEMSKAAAGNYGVFVGWGGWNEVGLKNLTDGSADYQGIYHVVPVLAGPDGQKQCKTNFNGGATLSVLCVTEKCADPTALIKLIDLFYDQEDDLGIQALYGPVGFNLYVDEAGVYRFLPTPEGTTYTNFRWTQTFNFFPLWTGEITGQKLALNANQTWKTKIDAEQGYIAAAATNKAAPTLSFTEEEQAELSMLETDLENQVRQYRAQAITGEKDIDATWDAYVANVQRLQADRVAQIYNAAYVRLMSLLEK